MNKAKLYKLANTLVGIVIGLIASWYLLHLVEQKSIKLDLRHAFVALKKTPELVIVVILLMPINWTIETYKWSQLIKRFQKLSFCDSIRSVFFGISLSLLTPNRIGDLGGRLLKVQKENRLKALYASLVCSYSQLLVTVIAGIIAIALGGFRIDFTIATPVLIALIIVLLWLFFASDYLKRFLRFINSKLKRTEVEEIEVFSSKERLKVLLLSLLRYLIFCLQFVTLLYIFNPEIELIHALYSVSIIYLISAVIPTAWISDLPVRTSIAYFVLDYYGYNGTIGLMGSILLWFLNLFIPAVVGFFFSPRLNLFSLKSPLNAD